MFIRKKKNRSGSLSIIIVDKSSGKYKELHTVGVCKTQEEIKRLEAEGRRWIMNKQYGERDLFSPSEEAKKKQEIEEVKQFLSNIDSIHLNGVELILNRVYKRVGFDKINDDILRQLVISRICQPSSKSGTVDYLLHYFDENVNLSKIYRYLDKLNDSQKEAVEKISVEHTKELLGDRIGVVFYDVTTLYFESDNGDDLRISGFSKDGKHSQPQIVLGLLVSQGGYPLAYSIHKGNQYEGTTMLPMVRDFIKRFYLDDFIVVSDAGLMNSSNIAELEANNYKYIVGVRIKNESKEVKEWILSQKKKDGSFYEIKKGNNSRLILGYSDSRAVKDRYNREKGVRRLEKAYKRGRLSKDNINRRGYNKFLEIERGVEVKINRIKIKEDAKWDGFKGYITNTGLSANDIYEQYGDLWQIERAFRVTKGKMEMRPIFHFTKERIEAHICICFIAYKCYKELERLMTLNNMTISIDKALFIAGAVTTIVVKLPHSKKKLEKTMLFKRHKPIEKLFSDEFWVAQ